MSRICEKAALVRSELNHIFTERPLQTSGGADFGWFCREHALHVAAYLTCLGHSTSLCVGDVIARVPRKLVASTIGTGSGHAWCAADGVVPIDLSITLKHLDAGGQDIGLVCGDSNRPTHFGVHYFRAASETEVRESVAGDVPALAYNEKLLVGESVAALLQEPFKFLHRPATGQKTLLDLYGPDVLFAITAHLLKLENGESKPLFVYQSTSNAIRTIVKRNPKARLDVLAKLSRAT